MNDSTASTQEPSVTWTTEIAHPNPGAKPTSEMSTIELAVHTETLVRAWRRRNASQ